ncbi:MAG: TRAP transporter large permease subunit [Candidatus Fermentithermobacillus carboniphilus]|uniref:TRAP transporter large permease subunit n=1 Tax=Candidatus Fermentithermobacillus carboniphilus TaxID=3085328 RepID=A0AAT9LAS0_9FIRM|nr:MAG: TRAP transporter large permease subunit [Candidatus Fermentithermobacillus carboniphilus]
MAVGIWSLIAYVVVIIFWNVSLKRNIGEAMAIGFVVTTIFAGSKAAALIWESLLYAAKQETVFAALAFVFMAYVMTETQLVKRLVNILNSVLGRFAGGAGYISTLASALFGLISGSGSGNAASVGSITIPWMINSNWPPELAATVVAGNAGLGIALPPCSSMFILLGSKIVSEKVSAGTLYLALLTAGLWTLLYRLILVRFFVRRYRIQPLPAEFIRPLGETLKEGWTSLLMFIGILLPVVLTIGPVAGLLGRSSSFGSKALDSISLIVWIPILITWIAILEGRRYLPSSLVGWYEFLKRSAQKYTVVGATLFFAFAASNAMTKLGLAKELTGLLQRMNVPAAIMVFIVGLLVTLVGAPLTSTATIAAIGAVAFSALVQVGVNPAVSAAAVLIFSSTEGATPPGAAPIFIASGIADVNPVKTFRPLLLYYVVPIIIIGCLEALGVLPILAR